MSYCVSFRCVAQNMYILFQILFPISSSSAGTKAPKQVEGGMMLILHQLKLGFCGPLPQFYAEFSSAQALSWIYVYPELKTSPVLLSGRHCFGKDPQCFPYLLKVNSFHSSSAWLCQLAQHLPRGDPSFQVTQVQVQISSYKIFFFLLEGY